MTAPVEIVMHTRRPQRQGQEPRTAARIAAYRLGTRLLDHHGRAHEFTHRHGVDALPVRSPTPDIAWTTSPQLICDAVERSNARNRIDHRLFREARRTIDWRIPRSLLPGIIEMARQPLVEEGMISIAALHFYGEAVAEESEMGRRWLSMAEALRWPVISMDDPMPDGPHLLRRVNRSGRSTLSLYQPHLHDLHAVRAVDVRGFGAPDPTWNRLSLAGELQAHWVGLLNEGLKACGHRADLDPRTGQVLGSQLPSRPFLSRTIFQINRRNLSGMHRNGAVVPVVERRDGAVSMLDVRNILDIAEHQILLATAEARREREARVAIEAKLTATTRSVETAGVETQKAKEARAEAERQAAEARTRAERLARKIDDLVAAHQAERDVLTARIEAAEDRAKQLLTEKQKAERTAADAKARLGRLEAEMAALAADARLGASLRQAETVTASAGDAAAIAATISETAPTLASKIITTSRQPADGDTALAEALGAIAVLRAAGVKLRTADGTTLALPPEVRASFAQKLKGQERLVATLVEANDLRTRPTTAQLERAAEAAFSRGDHAGAERIRTTLQPSLQLLGIAWQDADHASEVAKAITGTANTHRAAVAAHAALQKADIAAGEGRGGAAADIVEPQARHVSGLIRAGLASAVTGDTHLTEVQRALAGLHQAGITPSAGANGTLVLTPGSPPELAKLLDGRIALAGVLLKGDAAERDAGALRDALDALGNARDTAALDRARDKLAQLHPGAGSAVGRLLLRPRSIDAAFRIAKAEFSRLREDGVTLRDDGKGGLVAVAADGRLRPLVATETLRHLLSHQALAARPTEEQAQHRAERAAEAAGRTERDHWRAKLAPVLQRRGVMPNTWSAPAIAGLIDKEWTMPIPQGGGPSRPRPHRWSCPEAARAYEMLCFYAGVIRQRPTMPDADCSLRNAMIEAHNAAGRKPLELADDGWRRQKAEEVGRKHADRGQLEYAMASRSGPPPTAPDGDRHRGSTRPQARGQERAPGQERQGR